MSSQPLNQSIAVYRNVRAQRQYNRYESVEALNKGLRPLVMMVPGQEVLSGVQNRNTSLADFSSYMGQASAGSGLRGFPVVVGLNTQTAFATAQETMTGVDFAITIGRDKFITNTAAGLSRDLHADLVAVADVSAT